MTETVLILGDGQMGLVCADALNERGVQARIWSPFAEDARALAATRRSPRLSGFVLPKAVEVMSDDAAAFDDVSLIINAIPAQYVRSVWQRLKAHADPTTAVVSVTKGIENETLLRPTEVIEEVSGGDPNRIASRLGTPDRRGPQSHCVAIGDPCQVSEQKGDTSARTCVLSGPTIAAELSKRLPAAMVAASSDESLAERVQDLFNVPWLRIYRHDDPLGVELAGATKNVIALAAGMIDGLSAGDNAKSALLARGLSEIARLGVAMGARLDTFFGIAGVGDLATTCFSPSGRNRSCGERLGRGDSLEQILRDMPSVVEGVPTTKSVVALAERHSVEMPITNAVHAILFEGMSPRDAIRALMARESKAEQVG